MPEGKKAKNKKNYRLGTKTANEKRGAETAVPFLFFFILSIYIRQRQLNRKRRGSFGLH